MSQLTHTPIAKYMRAKPEQLASKIIGLYQHKLLIQVTQFSLKIRTLFDASGLKPTHYMTEGYKSCVVARISGFNYFVGNAYLEFWQTFFRAIYVQLDTELFLQCHEEVRDVVGPDLGIQNFKSFLLEIPISSFEVNKNYNFHTLTYRHTGVPSKSNESVSN